MYAAAAIRGRATEGVVLQQHDEGPFCRPLCKRERPRRPQVPSKDMYKLQEQSAAAYQPSYHSTMAATRLSFASVVLAAVLLCVLCCNYVSALSSSPTSRLKGYGIGVASSSTKFKVTNADLRQKRPRSFQMA